MKHRKQAACLSTLLAGAVLYLALYTVLVTPKRFFQCLDDPLAYLTREYEAEALPFPSLQPGNSVKLLVNGNEALPEMLQAIDSAQASIQWQVMVFHPDEAGKLLASALEAAARRGVKVQLSFDLSQATEGTLVAPLSDAEAKKRQHEMSTILQPLEQAGAVVLDSRPGIDFPLERTTGQPAEILPAEIQSDISRSSCISANHYDHRKILIIDGDTAIIGGMNVGNAYLYRIPPDLSQDMWLEAAEKRRTNFPEAWGKWQDVAVLVQGPVVAEIANEFNWRWELLGGQPLPVQEIPPAYGTVQAGFAAQRPGHSEVGSAYFHLIDQAQKEIYIASPYVSYDPILEALMEAGKRGVRVVFIFPNEKNEIDLSRRIFNERVDELLASGVEVYFDDLRMVHSKVMVVDGRWSVIGSFNLNYRSFHHDLEDAVFIDDAAFAGQVIERVFQPYQAQADRVLESENGRWHPQDLLDWVLQPFS